MPHNLHEAHRTGGVVDLRGDDGFVGGATARDIRRDVDERDTKAAARFPDGDSHALHLGIEISDPLVRASSTISTLSPALRPAR
ncbi:Uncharacterised protein [Mycobacteroides abscessus subsp. abscessus]|nr:Uncharacterised protein [Mycobacteroides abscessus subsp. abscessus]